MAIYKGDQAMEEETAKSCLDCVVYEMSDLEKKNAPYPFCLYDKVWLKSVGPYKDTVDFNSSARGRGKDFTEAQRTRILNANLGFHKYHVLSDAPDDCVYALMSRSDMLELEYQVDHIIPKKNKEDEDYGANVFSNAQVTSGKYNNDKNNTIDFLSPYIEVGPILSLGAGIITRNHH